MVTADDDEALLRLEEALWREETRFDLRFLESVLADDFIEYGRSGKTYRRDDVLKTRRQPIDAQLRDFSVRHLDDATAQVTYVSAVRNGASIEHGRRSSIWSKVAGRWLLRFHQGTPYEG